MIISHRHQIAFVHIPKCAGTSVRSQLNAISDTEIRFAKFKMHPVLGRVHMGHLPLWVIRDHYPDYFESLCAYRTYAVCREPHARFQSAVSEQLGDRLHGKSQRESQDLMVDTALRAIDAISGTKRLVDGNYCVFIPQTHFVYLDCKKIVKKIFQMQDVNILLQEISDISGKEFSTHSRNNQSLNFRVKSLEKPLRRLNEMASFALPKSIHNKTKQYVQKIAVRPPSEKVQVLKQRRDIYEFVEEYYFDDFLLYEQAGNTPMSDNSTGSKDRS